MKRFAIASVLALGLASSSFTALAAGDAKSDGSACGVATLRVTSRVDNTCQILVNGTLRATIGPHGDSGILSTAPYSTDRVTEVIARCENGAWYKTVKATYTHCEFIIAPRGESALTIASCI
jgi:hypothetical protein